MQSVPRLPGPVATQVDEAPAPPANTAGLPSVEDILRTVDAVAAQAKSRDLWYAAIKPNYDPYARAALLGRTFVPFASKPASG